MQTVNILGREYHVPDGCKLNRRAIRRLEAAIITEGMRPFVQYPEITKIGLNLIEKSCIEIGENSPFLTNKEL
jgi:hypothetical protein